MPGPAPKPTAIKVLAGNPGKRPLNGSEPQFAPEAPTCPRHLNAPARREWRRVVKVLADAGVMTMVDRAILALYCQAYGRWVIAEDRIAELEAQEPDSGMVQLTPNKMETQGVWLQIANRAMEQTKKYAGELGMTPAARTKIHAQSTEAKKSLVEELFEGVANGLGG